MYLPNFKSLPHFVWAIYYLQTHTEVDKSSIFSFKKKCFSVYQMSKSCKSNLYILNDYNTYPILRMMGKRYYIHKISFTIPLQILIKVKLYIFLNLFRMLNHFAA